MDTTLPNLTIQLLHTMRSAGVRKITITEDAYTALANSLKGLFRPELVTEPPVNCSMLMGIEIYMEQPQVQADANSTPAR